MRIEISVRTYKDEYGYQPMGNALASITIADKAVPNIPWAIVCAGLVEEAIADTIKKEEEKEQEESKGDSK